MEETIRGLKIGDTYLVNPADREWVTTRYDFVVGPYGDCKLSVYANSEDDALECLGDYLEKWLPNYLCTDEVDKEFTRLLEENGDIDRSKLYSLATADTIILNTQYIISWELCWSTVEIPKGKG